MNPAFELVEDTRGIVGDEKNAAPEVHERRGYVGGSDMANILGIEPYGCQRRGWFDKRSHEPLEETEHMRRGKFGEEAAAVEYSRITGRTVRNVGYRSVRVPGWEWMACHSDREILKDPRGVGLLSIKCPSLGAFRQIQRNGLPKSYIAQLQWEMWVTGRKWGAYAIMQIDSWRMEHWDVERDDVLITLLTNEAQKFWAQVENGPMPEALDAKSKPCARCQYFDRCHPMEIPADAGDAVILDDPAFAQLCAERDELRQIESDAEAARKALDEQIKAKAKGVVKCGGWKVLNYLTPRKGYTVAAGNTTVFRVIGG